eukprot:12855411-Alexandrium_andersonii.AAC.1
MAHASIPHLAKLCRSAIRIDKSNSVWLQQRRAAEAAARYDSRALFAIARSLANRKPSPPQ